MKRYLEDRILNDLRRKMVVLTGPRQVGKTYLARQMASRFAHPCFLNYDSPSDTAVIGRQSWPAETELLILDEIHKMPGWKAFLKGVYDTRAAGCSLLVTGSARMDTFRQAGESLAGRYYRYRLWPLSVAELGEVCAPQEAFRLLQRFGGFPEPFLSGSETEANRWRSQYYTDLIREDVLEFGRLQEIRAMRLLVELLRKRVGSPLSYASLAEDLKVAPNTVRHYVDILEALHIVFLVRPHHANLARAIQKEPKLYFYDSGYVQGDEDVSVENTTAVCLKKHVDYRADAMGDALDLCYIRTKDKREIDFALVKDGRPETLIEVKTADSAIHRDLVTLGAKMPGASRLQLVRDLRVEEDRDGVSLRRLPEWLANLEA
jgi:predicted AAA+ superfamily ATPase